MFSTSRVYQINNDIDMTDMEIVSERLDIRADDKKRAPRKGNIKAKAIYRTQSRCSVELPNGIYFHKLCTEML